MEFMESSEFKAINILRNIRDDSSVRFLDKTLDEAIEELKTLIEYYRVVKKQNDYYGFEERSCKSCKHWKKYKAPLAVCENSIFDFYCKYWEQK